jgi:hypothetical protein
MCVSSQPVLPLLDRVAPVLIEEGPMQRVNEFVFYELAIKVHAMTELTFEPIKYSDYFLNFWHARQSVDDIYRQRPLHFVTPVALRLYNAISAIVPTGWDQAIAAYPKDLDNEQPIAPWQISEIRDAAKEFETVLKTECQAMDTYYVSKKGTYSTKDLVENAHHQIPEPSRASLPSQAKADFDQAGKCIAFDVPTAAAFHLLRGTECVIKEYYELVVPGPKRANSKMRNWGVYIRLMREHKGDAKVLSLLDHMRDVYRNPVTHPEENYDDESVQVLFGLCISAVVLLIQAIHVENRKGLLLDFPSTPKMALPDNPV